MVKRFNTFLPVLLAVLLFGASEVYAQTATVVTHSGQRIRGQIVSMGDTGYGGGTYRNNRNANDFNDSIVVRSSGRDQRIPIQDVAFVDFAGNGTVSQTELNRANRANDGIVVLRNGRSLIGRVLNLRGINGNNNELEVSGQGIVPLNQVARVYFGNGNVATGGYNPNYNPNPNVYSQNDPRYGNGQYGQYGQYGQARQPSYAAARTVTIPTNQTWSNSGMDVSRGQVIHFRATCNTTLSQNPGDNGTPNGANSGRMAGNSPLPGVTGGMLIGRVGNSQPFAIGADADVTMPASGRLYFGVNDDDVRDNTGSFVVSISPR